jgi:hypothetical protein
MGRASGRPVKHEPFGHLYLRAIMMVLASVAATSFAILLLFSFPSCLCLRTTPILGRGRWGRRLLPVFVQHQPAQWLLHVHENVSQYTRTIVFVVVGRPVRLSGLRPVFPLQPTAPAHRRSRETTDALRRGYGASQSCSYPFFVRAAEEDTVASVTLRLSWR